MRLFWSYRARADLARIHTFNLSRSEAWAERVDARLAERASSLAVTPFAGRKAGNRGRRFLPVPDIQYVILYEVGPEQVTILRVHSTRENRDFE